MGFVPEINYLVSCILYLVSCILYLANRLFAYEIGCNPLSSFNLCHGSQPTERA